MISKPIVTGLEHTGSSLNILGSNTRADDAAILFKKPLLDHPVRVLPRRCVICSTPYAHDSRSILEAAWQFDFVPEEAKDLSVLPVLVYMLLLLRLRIHQVGFHAATVDFKVVVLLTVYLREYVLLT